MSGPRRVLVDTGPLVAIFSSSDEYHDRCVDILKTISAPLLTCWPVITEAAWLLRSRPIAVQKLLKSTQSGLIQLLPLEAGSIGPIVKYLEKYQERGAQLADVCLLHLAEREQIMTLFTLDHRDFTVYRFKSNRRLKLLPSSI